MTVDRFVSALEKAESHERPYPHWMLKDVLPSDMAAELKALPFDPPPPLETQGKRDTNNSTRRFFDTATLAEFPVINQLAEAFQDPRTIRVIEDECDARLEGSFLRIEYAQDRDSFWLQPHTDVGPKRLTMMVYLSDQPGAVGWGTDILDEDHEIMRTVPSPFNGGMIFVPSDRSWHAFHRREISGVRKSLIINYVTDDWRNTHELAYPDQPVTR